MAIDFTKIYENYKGMWVALKDDKKTVIANGNTVKEVIDEARKKGFEKPILFRVPLKVIPYIGS